MNTLEDAYVNIGMDEEKFLKNNLNLTSTKYSDFSNIPVPAGLSHPPSYNFTAQVNGMFKRRF
jgi:ATP-binding cassette subfamily A (ABC1) protein 3